MSPEMEDAFHRHLKATDVQDICYDTRSADEYVRVITRCRERALAHKTSAEVTVLWKNATELYEALQAAGFEVKICRDLLGEKRWGFCTVLRIDWTRREPV